MRCLETDHTFPRFPRFPRFTMEISNWTDRVLDTTFFVVNVVHGKVKHLRIVDECYNTFDMDLQYEALQMTPEQREENGIYTARQLDIDYKSVMDYNRHTDLYISATFGDRTLLYYKEEKRILSEIQTYWYECADTYFEPMTRRLVALVAWDRDPGFVPEVRIRKVIEDAW